MKKPNFRDMLDEEFAALLPRTEEEIESHEVESDFRKWCQETEQDPQDEGARASYDEMQEEVGPKFWENLSEEDRAGWEDNIIKSFDN